jgi:hypothetical protein
MTVDVKERAALAEKTKLDEADRLINKKIELETQQIKWEQNFFDCLDSMYDYSDKEELIGFLKEHKEVWEILLGAPSQLSKHFDAPLKLMLEFFVDPEYPVHKSIAVWFGTKLGIEETFAAWDKFGEEWWRRFPPEQVEFVHFHNTSL